MAPPTNHNLGLLLPNGTRLVHGAGAASRDAFPPNLGIPGRLQTFSVGHANNPTAAPCFCGPQGCLPFDTETRMPRHVHMAVDPSNLRKKRYVVEKIMVVDGVAVAELGGEIYVIPPYTLVLIGAGVPHTWTACPMGIDFGALGFDMTQSEEGPGGSGSKAIDTMLSLKNKCIHPQSGKPYIISSKGGKECSVEGMQNGITHVFIVDFASVEDRNYYAKEDPEHLAFGASLGPNVKQVQVVDIEEGVF
ncbi:hypothetical protein CBS147353_10661 [Aspergillus niger]|nr:hypothetical protein CBS147353_10661 [Aspergillus niger]